MPAAPPESAGVAFPPPILYALGFGIGYGLHRLRPVALQAGGGRMRIVVGGVLIALAAGLAASALLLFRRAGTSPIPHKPTTALVVRGPYRFTRNPMYVSLAALYLGLGLLVNSLWPLLCFPVVIGMVERWVIVREEAYLERRFGDAYRAYRRRVRRWL